MGRTKTERSYRSRPPLRPRSDQDSRRSPLGEVLSPRLARLLESKGSALLEERPPREKLCTPRSNPSTRSKCLGSFMRYQISTRPGPLPALSSMFHIEELWESHFP